MQNHYNHQEQGFQLDDGDDDDPTDNTDNHEAEQPQHDQQLQAVQQHDQHIQPAQQPMPNTGILTRLQEQGKQAAKRTVQRLHRNLGASHQLGACQVAHTTQSKQQHTASST